METENNELNTERFFVSTIKKLAKEQGIETVWTSGNWICELKKGKVNHFLYGYNFPLNTMTSAEIALDKTATSTQLLRKGIPCVAHTLFMRPELEKFISKNSTENNILEFVSQNNSPLVCKNNRGKGGHEVYKVENQDELVVALNTVWDKARGAALCPFYDIENEYRFFVLDGEIQFAYKKIKNSNEWKFNLSKGGSADLCNIDHFPNEVIKNVISATFELDLRICSVDIIKLKDCENYLILEVNTGISVEYFSQMSDEALELSEDLYSRILEKIFE